jgi:hypothetical protein
MPLIVMEARFFVPRSRDSRSIEALVSEADECKT